MAPDLHDEDAPLLPSLTVDYTDAEFTGLLDKQGNEIVRLPERMGFIHANETKAQTET